MSPLWRDEVGICLTPHSVLLNRVARGLHPKVVASETLEIHETGSGSWTTAVVRLRQALQDTRWQNANLRIVVADMWARYCIIPPHPELATDEERLRFGEHSLREIFGESMKDWASQLARTADDRPAIACALPRAMLEEILEISSAARLKLLSLQPHLVYAFNRVHDRIPDDSAWFVSIYDSTLSAVRIEARCWAEVRSVRIGKNWADEIKRLQAFGRLLNGQQAATRVLVDAPLWLRNVGTAFTDGLEWLEPQAGRAPTSLEQLSQQRELLA
ncbi:MAG: hypothetical protein R3E77_14685 [Steroidobacteraceae bacterium]